MQNKVLSIIARAKQKALDQFDQYNLDMILGIEASIMNGKKITGAELIYLYTYVG